MDSGLSALTPGPDRDDPENMTTAILGRRAVSLSRILPLRADAVSALMVGDPGAFVGAHTDHGGGADRRRIGVDVFGTRLEREVKIGLGPPIEEDDGTTVLPLWWEAAESPWLFPTFDGGIEVEDVETGTELRLVGSCRPPLGRLGAFADDVAGFRVARATLESFLDELAARLMELGVRDGLP